MLVSVSIRSPSRGQSATPGYYTLAWDFTIASVAQELQTYIQIGATNPAYDAARRWHEVHRGERVGALR